MPVDEASKIIADYVSGPQIESVVAMETARHCLADSLGTALLALNFPECTKLLGPVVPGTLVPHGSRVPGTSFILDPICAAFNLGTMIRWLDYNDTWLAAEWGHPSDNLGGLLMICDYLSQQQIAAGKAPLTMKDLLQAMIKAYEIQGGLALQNSFHRVGLDHVILVKVATAAVVCHLLGGTHKQVLDVVSQAWVDLGSLRCYRHAPSVGSRKSWAAGDATSRGVFLALLTMKGELGYAQALSAKNWGLYDVLFAGRPFVFERPLGSYVMENILFKVAFPAEFHAQTAVEAAFKLHPLVKDKLTQIKSIDIETHASAIRIIDKQGELKNPADRDHCLQYMVAVGLLKGELSAEDYEDKAAQEPRIDWLRSKMQVKENAQFSRDYLDPDKRSIANALTVTFGDGTHQKVVIEYPLGHRKRRGEALPLLYKKCAENFSSRFHKGKVEQLLKLFQEPLKLYAMPVSQFVDHFVSAEKE